MSVMEPEILFRHKPLTDSSKQIRVIRLLAGDESQIVCELRHGDRPVESGYPEPDLRLKYTALSYTWGPPDPGHHILINGRQFFIRQNLYDFLKQMRVENFKSYLWIDQICINQDDILEKNVQVSNMADVYQKAERTITWLGGADACTDIAAKCLSGHNLDFRRDRFSEEEWKAVSQLFSRPYWTRLWIAQELIKSSNVIVRCGAYSFNFPALARFFRWTSNDGEKPSFPNEEKLRLYTRHLVSMRSVADNGVRDLLRILHDSGCVDPRDKLYAIWSFLHTRDKSRLIVDYAKSAMGVFLDIVKVWGGYQDLHTVKDDDITPLATLAGVMLPALFDTEAETKLTAWLVQCLHEVQVQDIDSSARITPWLKETVVAFLKHEHMIEVDQ